MAAVGERHPDQAVALFERDGVLALAVHIDELGKARLLDRCLFGRHEHELVLVEFPHRQNDGNLFAFLKLEQIHNGLALGVARALGDEVDLETVDAAEIAEAKDLVVRVGDKELLDHIAFLHLGGALASAAAALLLIFGQSLALDIALAGKGDNSRFARHEVERIEVRIARKIDFTAASVAILGLELKQFLVHDPAHALGLGEDVEQIGHLGMRIAVVAVDLVLFESGEFLQRHLKDLLSLDVRQVIQAVGAQAAGRIDLGRTVLRRVSSCKQSLDKSGLPAPCHQLQLGNLRSGCSLDHCDELIDVRERDRLSFENVAAHALLAEPEDRAAVHHFPAVAQERLDHLAQVHELGLAVLDHHHVDAEGALHLGELEQIVEDHLAKCSRLEFDHDAHVLARLVADVVDSLKLLVAHQRIDVLNEHLLVDLVGNIVNDDRLPAAGELLKMRMGADDHPAAAGAIALVHALHAVDDAAGRKIGSGHPLDQLVDACLGMRKQMPARLDHFGKVVRRNAGGHAYGNACRTVQQQIGQPGRQHHGLLFGIVKVGLEVDRLFVKPLEHHVGNLRQTALRVTHCRRAVSVDGAEIALPEHQRIAHGEVLRQSHERLVYGLVAVRVVLADHVTHDAGALLGGIVERVVQLVHRKQDSAVNRLEAVPHIGQRTIHNHAHGVIAERIAHLLDDVLVLDPPPARGHISCRARRLRLRLGRHAG